MSKGRLTVRDDSQQPATSVARSAAPDAVQPAAPDAVRPATADAMQPASANTPLIESTNALDKGEAEIHDGADHGFGVYGPGYHEAAADRSYERAKVMFDRELKG